MCRHIACERALVCYPVLWELQKKKNEVIALSCLSYNAGVVDKSVELLNTQEDPFSLSALFSQLSYFKINRWSGKQVDNYQYCRDQFNVDGEGM